MFGIQNKGITIFYLSNAATFMDLMKPPVALSVGSSQCTFNFVLNDCRLPLFLQAISNKGQNVFSGRQLACSVLHTCYLHMSDFLKALLLRVM